MRRLCLLASALVVTACSPVDQPVDASGASGASADAEVSREKGARDPALPAPVSRRDLRPEMSTPGPLIQSAEPLTADPAAAAPAPR